MCFIPCMNHSSNCNLIALVLLPLIYCSITAQINDIEYPDKVIQFNIRNRNGYHSEEMVKRGVSDFFLSAIDSAKQIRNLQVSEAKHHLQCSFTQLDLEGNRGAIKLLKYLNFTTRAVAAIAAWAETGCDTWYKCHMEVSKMRNQNSSQSIKNNNWPHGKLLWLYRLINSTLYADWPWKRRQEEVAEMNKHSLMLHTLLIINGFRDTVFLIALENPKTPFNFPFPVLTNSPSQTSSDIPLPWNKPYQIELEVYRKIYRESNFDLKRTQEQLRHHYNQNNPSDDNFWKSLLPIGIFRGTLNKSRGNIYFLATIRPDLLHVSWHNIDCCEYTLHPLNPDSPEIPEKYNPETNRFPVQSYESHTSNSPASTHTAINIEPGAVESSFGFLNSITRFHVSEPRPQTGYKYVIVLKGRASADRLETFLLHCGCVLLIQSTNELYHFSSRFIPWVHYVPLATNVADVIEKIEWLQRHDNMARRIAANARNFAHSYLRLEDYYCYMIELFDRLGEVFEGTEALSPFHVRSLVDGF